MCPSSQIFAIRQSSGLFSTRGACLRLICVVPDVLQMRDAAAAAFPESGAPLRAVHVPYRICPLGAHSDHQVNKVSHCFGPRLLSRHNGRLLIIY